ncbi:hypothetical protein [Siphonobacter sp. SORGH_AS_0500]|uniref:hypothetical protein n=1 Tax=Siphonobacter sp. SORGH_AS_0500 TaxID=1864824 RepID=UPI00285DB0DB|nr:hypothetical protein [Siphonobacter sp. SORGH_AS_0500]MDR6197969.1 hypothetical protein [Siphonobacter sp. SORGH_AS_0500]
MKLLAKNEEVISFLSDKESLISGTIKKISIQIKSNILFIGLDITLMYSKKYKSIYLEFEAIKEYGFYYLADSSFSTIEIYKFFKNENLFYISFDPTNEELIMDKNDNDFILAEKVSLYQSSG